MELTALMSWQIREEEGGSGGIWMEGREGGERISNSYMQTHTGPQSVQCSTVLLTQG